MTKLSIDRPTIADKQMQSSNRPTPYAEREDRERERERRRIRAERAVPQLQPRHSWEEGPSVEGRGSGSFRSKRRPFLSARNYYSLALALRALDPPVYVVVGQEIKGQFVRTVLNQRSLAHCGFVTPFPTTQTHRPSYIIYAISNILWNYKHRGECYSMDR